MPGRSHAGAGVTTAEADDLAYREHERSVLAMLSTRYPDLDPDGRRELYHEAWASILKRRAEGAEIQNVRAYLLGATDKLAAKRVYGADARRRLTFDPKGPRFSRLPDLAPPPDEAVVASDEARRVRMLVDELGEAERAVLKLRIDLGLDPPEIRERLGLTERQYRRTAERAGRSLLAQFRAFDRGDWARGKRSLLCACVMGVASDNQRERAQRLVEEDPYCRAMMAELRELAGNAAALLPLPTGTIGLAAGSDGVGARLADIVAQWKSSVADLSAQVADGRKPAPLSNLRRQAGEAVVGAKQHAANTYVRVADPTPLGGARPGAAAAIVAGCVAAGGGAYCAVEGVPEGLRAPVGLERSQADAEPAPPSSSPSPAPAPTPDPPVLATEPPPQPTTPAPPPAPAAPVPRQAPPAPPPQPENEFEPAAPAAQGAVDAQRPAAPAEPAPAQGGAGEFGP